MAQTWKKFKLTDIFRPINMITGPRKYDTVTEENGVPLYGTSMYNEGIIDTINSDKVNELNIEFIQDYKEDCILVSRIAKGLNPIYVKASTKFVTVKVNTGALKLKKIYPPMDREIAFFLQGILYELGLRKYFDHKYDFTGPRYKRETFELPVDTNGEPDWKYMKDVVNKLGPKLDFPKRIFKPKTQLITDKWSIFKISDIFNVYDTCGVNVKDIDFDKHGNGVPVIGTGFVYDGVLGRSLKNEELTLYDKNVITIPTTGSYNAIYRHYDFYVTGASIKQLKIKCEFGKELNSCIGTFLSYFINERIKIFKFGYGLSKGRLLPLEIKLPTTPEGTPDWDFMERYIKEIEGTTDETT